MLQLWHTVYPNKLHRLLRPLAAGNALQWSLRKLDARLAESEKNPTASDQAAWRLGSGPVGVTAAKGVSKAAQLSITAGQKVIKVIFRFVRYRCTSVIVTSRVFRLSAVQAALPLSQQALGQGAGLAWKLLQGRKQQHRKHDG